MRPHMFTKIAIPAHKTEGWELQAPRKDYWHKIIFERTMRETCGFVIEKFSNVVVFASTSEPVIQKYLYSCTDVSAAMNIGRILAHRCHQSGLVHCFFDTVENSLSSEAIKAFYDSLVEGGLQLEEPTGYYELTEPVGINYDALTQEEKRALYPSLIEVLRTTPDWHNISYPYSLRPVAGKRKLKNSYQILSKVRQGMVWDQFYKRMVHPRNMAYWQPEFVKWQTRNLEADKKTIKFDENEVDKLVPVKWQLG